MAEGVRRPPLEEWANHRGGWFRVPGHGVWCGYDVDAQEALQRVSRWALHLETRIRRGLMMPGCDDYRAAGLSFTCCRSCHDFDEMVWFPQPDGPGEQECCCGLGKAWNELSPEGRREMWAKVHTLPRRGKGEE